MKYLVMVGEKRPSEPKRSTTQETKGKFHKLGNKLVTSTGNQIKKFFKKKKKRRMAKKAFHKVGREIFAPKKLRLNPSPRTLLLQNKS